MDHYTQELFKKWIQDAKDQAEKNKNLMEAIARRHAELDQKLGIIKDRLTLIEEILGPEIQKKTKEAVQTGEKPAGFFAKMFGRA